MIIALLILSLTPIAAWADKPCPQALEERTSPCTPGEGEQLEIKLLIDAGLTANAFAESSARQEKRLRDAVLALKDRAQSEEGRALLADWSIANDLLNEQKEKAISDFKLALQKTREYYGITGFSGTIANGPMRGEKLDWDPEFYFWAKDGKDYPGQAFKMDRSDGVSHYHTTGNRTPDDVAAMTLPNGRTSIFWSAFRDAQIYDNPGVLAVSLLHERIHFSELTSNGWKSGQEEEERAWNLTVQAADDLGVPKSKPEREGLELNQAEAIKKVKLAREHPNDPKYRLRSPFADATQDERYRKQFETAQKEVVAATEARSALTAEFEAIKKRAEELRDKERLERLRDTMTDISRRACNDTGFIMQEELDALPPAPNGPFCAPSNPSLEVCRLNVFGLLCARMGVPGALRVRWLKFEAYGWRPFSASSLAAFASKACAAPWMLKDLNEELDGSFPMSEIPGAEEAGQGLSGCSKEFYDKLLYANSYLISRHQWAIDPDWVKYWTGRLYSKQMTPPLQGFVLANFAKFACANPGAVTEKDLNRIVMNLYPNRSIFDAQETAAGLYGCDKELFNKLVELNGELSSKNQDLDIDWLNWWAKELSRKYAPPPVRTPPPGNERPQRPGREPGCGPCGDCGSGCGRPRPRLP